MLMNQARRKRAQQLLKRIVLCVVTTIVMLVLAETALRVIEQAAPSGTYTLKRFIREFPVSQQVRAEWIHSSPEPLQPFEVLPEHARRYNQVSSGVEANHLWNEHFVENYFAGKIPHASYAFLNDLDPVHVFQAPWGTPYPRYRFPARVTLPCGLTTNSFGWRGRAISLNKPPRTIRIACVGASTTVDMHRNPFSYPQFLEHWLNMWGREQGHDLHFEVINAGRSGINSTDIAAVVRYEVVPMAVDYVIYYEGANQFNPLSMVRYGREIKFGAPPPGLIPELPPKSSQAGLRLLSEYSVLARRVQALLEAFDEAPLGDGREPAKPDQKLVLPRGIQEEAPPPSKESLGTALQLATILDDLCQIKEDLGSKKGKLILSTFDWLVYEGMVLHPVRHRGIYTYLNRKYWPITYQNMRRMADFQNRVFRAWAENNGIDLIDVAGQMPREPDLYVDAIHNSVLGVRIRAWIVFQALLPIVERDLQQGIIPVPDAERLTEHPYLNPRYTSVRHQPAKNKAEARRADRENTATPTASRR